MAEMVNIRHPKTNAEYAILPSDFTSRDTSPDGKSYAERGFVIVAYEDGKPYDGPKSQREIDTRAEERLALRQERAAAKADKPAEKKDKE